MSHSNFSCCLKNLANGSVSCVLDRIVPETWTSSWTADINGTKRMTIVSEDGKVHPDVVVSQTERGYILKQLYPNIACRLESPEDGVSNVTFCEGLCDPVASTNPDSGFNPWLLVGLVLLVLLVIAGIVGYVFYQKQRRNRAPDANANSPLEMDPLNGQNPNAQDHQQAAE